ncbi:putative U-box domain-containing protein 50 [Asparagus officinalis]|uniref:putative U-box domain-containing protein 50 n=1 Tax=Asparagus officinalis TaxID=4686 RepID=UPI00098E4571|nr:putative U-box domain-containing protein 50 [Asparagus officinalis]
METHQEKIYVALGKNIEEELVTLRWALNHWSSQSVSFVILHINTSSRDFVQTPFGKLPASSVNEEMLEAFRAQEHERVKKILNKYMALCIRVKAEVLEVNISKEPVPKILVGLISSHGIKKLVMGFKSMKSSSWKAKCDTNSSCYVQKHKPDFCELFTVYEGKLVIFKEENADEGGYLIDECGTMVADFRKKPKEKGNLRGWFSRKFTDNVPSNEDDQRSPHHVVSNSATSIVHEVVRDKWEENVEEIDRYVQFMLDSNSQELEQRDETRDELEVTKTNKNYLSRNEVLRAVEQTEKILEQKRNEAKADAEIRRKSDRIFSLCNQRTEEIEAKLREDRTKQNNLTQELNTVRSQRHEIFGNITESKNKLKSELDHQREFMINLQAYSLKKSDLESALAMIETEKNEILGKVEETRRQREFVKRRNEYYRIREEMGKSFRYREFNEEEIRNATDDFATKMAISADLEGVIYRGRIDRIDVVVQFKTVFLDSLEEFQAQVKLLHKINHPHILTMTGACAERRCIVFEYMHHGSLHNILFSSSKKPTLQLPWHARIRIIVDVCSALGFLHSSKPSPTVHGRLNSSHVLLGHNFTVKIMGLSYNNNARPSSDILNLGLLILQLLTGNEEIGLQEVSQAIEEDTLAGNLDERAGDWPLDIAMEFAKIGLQCCENEARYEENVAVLIGEIMNLQAKAESRTLQGGEKIRSIDVPDVFLCPIFQFDNIIEVIITTNIYGTFNICTYGFTYEYEAIKEWLSSGHDTSPMTNLRLKNKLITPNHTLQCLIRDRWRDER